MPCLGPGLRLAATKYGRMWLCAANPRALNKEARPKCHRWDIVSSGRSPRTDQPVRTNPPRQTLYHDHCSWLLQSSLERATLQDRAVPLTAREREVFELVAAGEPNQAIARHLGISFRTVELHRAHIIEKLQARSLSDLMPTAGWLPRASPWRVRRGPFHEVI